MGRLSGLVDGLVDAINPAAGLRRRAARLRATELERIGEELEQASNRRAKFGAIRGAKNSRLHSSWLGATGSADSDILDDLATTRERARDLCYNDPLAAGLLQTLVDNIAGRGLRPQSMPRTDELRGVRAATVDRFRAAANAAWKRWTEGEPDSTGRHDWNSIVRLVTSSTIQSGDIFSRQMMLPRRGSPYDLALELVEADRVETPGRLLQDATIRGGVKIGKRGQMIGVFLRDHPGDDPQNIDDFGFVRRYSPTGHEQISQVLFHHRPGQNRGLSAFAPTLSLFDHLSNYIQSEVVAARVAACISLIVTKKDPLAAARLRAAQDNEDERLEELAPGQVEYLSEGESVEVINPQRPGAVFDPFVVRIIRLICRGLGLPYEIGALDFSASNYSNMRAAQVETRRTWQVRQLTIARWATVIYRRVIEEAWLRGDLPGVDLEANLDAWLGVVWTMPGWQWVDPEKEIAASVLAVENRFSTRRREVAQWTGEWWEDVERERILEELRVKELRAELGADEDEETGDDDDGEEPAEDESEETETEDEGDAGDSEESQSSEDESEEGDEELSLELAGATR